MSLAELLLFAFVIAAPICLAAEGFYSVCMMAVDVFTHACCGMYKLPELSFRLHVFNNN